MSNMLECLFNQIEGKETITMLLSITEGQELSLSIKHSARGVTQTTIGTVKMIKDTMLNLVIPAIEPPEQTTSNTVDEDTDARPLVM